jgi:dsRNA-specific ribonuclease
LEYLGDAIINSVVAEYLFKKYPFENEGFLTELRSKIVSRSSLNDLALKIGLSKLVEYDRKALQNINLRNSIFGNALEAFVGAILVGFVDTMGRTLLPHLFREIFSPQFASAAGPAVASILVYLLMAVVLFVRPQGLFSGRS